jgi:isoleucyl-tRNA synthetase
MYGCENAADIRLGPSTIEDLEKRIHKFRNSFRFILGTLHGYEGQRPSSLPLLDQVCIY